MLINSTIQTYIYILLLITEHIQRFVLMLYKMHPKLKSSEKKRMDFVKLEELPRPSASFSHGADAKAFKSYKVRSTHDCGVGSDVSAICFSPNSESSEVAVASGSIIQICGVDFGKIEQRVNWSKHKNMVTCLSYRRDGKLLLAGDADGHANIYDVDVSRSIIRRLRGHEGKLTCAVFVPDNTRVVTGSEDQTVKVWDIPTGQVVGSLRGHSDSVRCLVSIGESSVISGGSDGNLCVWDLSNCGGDLTSTPTVKVNHGAPIERFAVFSSGALLFSIGGGIVNLWDIGTMALIKTYDSKHTKPVTGAVVSPCGDFIATSSFDQTIKITRIDKWLVVASFTSPSPITAFSWNNCSMLIGLETGTVQLRQRKISATPTPYTSVRYYQTLNEDSSAPSSSTSTVNYMLRKFEYRKLFDFVVQSTPKGRLAMAVVDELSQRGGLEAALRNRSLVEIIQIVDWCGRNFVIDSRCSLTLVNSVFTKLVELNARTFAQPSQELRTAVMRLSGRLGTEATVQLKAVATIGLLEAVMV